MVLTPHRPMLVPSSLRMMSIALATPGRCPSSLSGFCRCSNRRHTREELAYRLHIDLRFLSGCGTSCQFLAIFAGRNPRGGQIVINGGLGSHESELSALPLRRSTILSRFRSGQPQMRPRNLHRLIRPIQRCLHRGSTVRNGQMSKKFTTPPPAALQPARRNRFF